MHNILKVIVEKKKDDVINQKKQVSVHDLQREISSYIDANENKEEKFLCLFKQKKTIRCIAEIKLASPTEGILGSENDLYLKTSAYEKAGVDAMSYVTEEHYFHGNMSFIPEIKRKTRLPILQKDFVIDAYQIYQAKIVGSNALLLIAQLIDKETLQEFVSLSMQLGIEPIVEIHTEKDLLKALTTQTRIIAVNARDLGTFSVDVHRACRLLQKVPDTVIKLGFSGIYSDAEVVAYKQAGVDGVLIGTALMKSNDVRSFIATLPL